MKINPKLSREELRLEMCRLQDEAFVYRRAIERIDKKANEEKYKKLLHRCFFRNGYEYLRIDKYDKNYQLIGTEICDFGDEEGIEIFKIEFNTTIYEDYLQNATEISNEQFNIQLQKAADLIKYQQLKKC